MNEYDYDITVGLGGEKPELVGNNVVECSRVPVTIVDGERVRDEDASEMWWVDENGRPLVEEPAGEPEEVVVATEASRWQKIKSWFGFS